jgi:hypothetical protein
MNSTSWRIQNPFNTNMTISERRATTAFDRSNFTIIDVISISDPTPMNYTPEDFFLFYSYVLAVNESQPNYFTTVQYLFLTAIAAYLDEVDPQLEAGAAVSNLHQFLATPLLIFNRIMYRGTTPNMGKSIALAIPSYRVFLPVCISQLTYSWLLLRIPSTRS